MKEKIMQLLMELRPEFDFKESNDFVDDGLLDSFDIVTLVTDLENEFACLIDPMDILPEYFSSVDSISRLVEKSKN